MTKKLFFLAVIFLGCSIESLAQCTPDSTVTGLYSPDLNEGLPDGTIGVFYETVITLNVPPDTSYLSLTAVVDSMVLTGVSGLPSGFDYTCSPPSCGFPGGDFGCILISGISNDNADATTHDIDATFQFYLKQPAVTLPYTLQGYSITLDSGAALSAPSIEWADRTFGVQPNPANLDGYIVFDLTETEQYSLDIVSLIGTTVAHREGAAKANNRLRIGDLVSESGVYFVTLRQGAYSRTVRFIVP